MIKFIAAAAMAAALLSPESTRRVCPFGFSASTAIADSASVYLRYVGDIAGQDSSHALTAGLRMTW